MYESEPEEGSDDSRPTEADYTGWEMEAAIERGNKWSAASPNRTCSSGLKNLNDGGKKKLLELVNRIRLEGHVPRACGNCPG